ncbi:TetR/AcrR family transcriptional regulator [Gordonia zhaorongruii]|uniref:TetR/AcrR family transcriptional regulator n=1 Tax=Gordonia zhaorongruii TaxID=2597659 RepID=UPI001F242ED7|nr:TetR family transcriptional regulator [Gordonia zhaorongruii]
MFNERVQSGREVQRERTREHVITAAQSLFTEYGFADTTVRRIAAAAQVSVGTVMSVGDKDALLIASFDRWIGAVHRGRAGDAAPVGANTATSPIDRIGDVVQPFLDIFAADMDLAREYGAVLARGTHSTEVFGELAVALHRDFATVFTDAGLGEDATAAATAVYLAYLGLVMTSAITGNDVAAIRTQIEGVAAVLIRRR